MNHRSPRYRVIENGPTECTLRFADGREQHYWCPSGGGYVREVTEHRYGTLGDQVCDQLGRSGSTLRLSDPERWPLVNLIRREARRLFAGDEVFTS